MNMSVGGGGNGRLHRDISVTFFPRLKRGWRGKIHSAFYLYTLAMSKNREKIGKNREKIAHFPSFPACVIRYSVRLFIVVVQFEETRPPRYFRPSIPRMKFHPARGKRPPSSILAIPVPFPQFFH